MRLSRPEIGGLFAIVEAWERAYRDRINRIYGPPDFHAAVWGRPRDGVCQECKVRHFDGSCHGCGAFPPDNPLCICDCRCDRCEGSSDECGHGVPLNNPCQACNCAHGVLLSGTDSCHDCKSTEWGDIPMTDEETEL